MILENCFKVPFGATPLLNSIRNNNNFGLIFGNAHRLYAGQPNVSRITLDISARIEQKGSAGVGLTV